MTLPYLVFSDAKGTIYHHPWLRMTVASQDMVSIPAEESLIRMPSGSGLFYLPGRHPVGFNPTTKKIEVFSRFEHSDAYAVSAFPIPAYLRLYHPASSIHKKTSLPLWAYTACGYRAGNFYMSAVRIDKRVRQSPRFYDQAVVEKKIKDFFVQYPHSRLFQHLAHCARAYNCLAAKNFFLERWEAPVPTARFCNARCLGCLSYQAGTCHASHQRIQFKPSVDEIVTLMYHHLSVAREAIVSFGQGCEGEPLLEARLIAASISKVRASISRGTVNMNTNASIPKNIELLCKAGIDSFRVSLNSPDEKYYRRYFRPQGYTFKDVLRSIAVAKKYGKFVSINLFIFPGFSDSQAQIKQLIQFIKITGIDMIQWRNLNIDPVVYTSLLHDQRSKPQGVARLIALVRQEFPKLVFGYFNLPKEQWRTNQYGR